VEQKLLSTCHQVLAANDRGSYTVPSANLYPHQWLWDSCFIAIGLGHINIERAQTEIRSLLKAQWANGMLPHIIFADAKSRWYTRHEEAWLNPHSPNGLITSGITQPPMLAEAIVQVGNKLSLSARRQWYKEVLPALIRYHQWIYKERVHDGLAILVHPYESGLDNSPPNRQQMRLYAWPWWLKLTEAVGATKLISLVRRDTKSVPGYERNNNSEAIADWALMRRLRKTAYDSQQILKKPHFAVEDLVFNSILIRANEHLAEIAKTAGLSLPAELSAQFTHSQKALDYLWDEAEGQYFSRSLLSGELTGEPSIATLLPLYSGSITTERAQRLVELLQKRGQFRATWPVPGAPTGSKSFSPWRYWQGPSWVNTNWLIIEGLNRYGFKEEADSLKQKTIELVAKGGCHEYFNPHSGKGLGAANFSWTAALTIDLLGG